VHEGKWRIKKGVEIGAHNWSVHGSAPVTAMDWVDIAIDRDS